MNGREGKIFSLIIAFLFINSIALIAREEVRPPDLTDLKKVVNELMKDWKVPGLGIAVVKDGKILLTEGFGLRNVEHGLKVTPQTIFPIASCTKTFTAVSLAILVDEGKLKWDIPIKEYLPSLRFSDDYISNHITLRDLLTHRSGLPQHYRMYFNRHLTRVEFMERLRFLEPSRGFRETFQYANLNYMIAAYLLEKVTNGTWEDFTKEKIFDSLEMKNTNFSISQSQKSSDYALPYREENGKIIQASFLNPNIMGMGPAGSINSNAHDMANWLLFHLNNGKYKDRRVISEACLSETQKPQIVMSGGMSNDMFYWSYGMGWAITSYRGHLMLGHGGGFDGFSCYVSVLLRDKIGCAILCDKEGSPVPQVLTRIIYDRLLGLAELPRKERTKKSLANSKTSPPKKEDFPRQQTKLVRPLEDYCGEFEHPAYGMLIIKKERDQLFVVHNGLTSPLTHLFYDIFETRDEKFEKFRFSFISDDKGDINRVEVPFEPTVKAIIFSKILKGEKKEKSQAGNK